MSASFVIGCKVREVAKVDLARRSEHLLAVLLYPTLDRLVRRENLRKLGLRHGDSRVRLAVSRLNSARLSVEVSLAGDRHATLDWSIAVLVHLAVVNHERVSRLQAELLGLAVEPAEGVGDPVRQVADEDVPLLRQHRLLGHISFSDFVHCVGSFLAGETRR